MNAIVLTSPKIGSGENTLAAHLAAHCRLTSHFYLLVDAEPLGSLKLWRRLRKNEEPGLKMKSLD